MCSHEVRLLHLGKCLVYHCVCIASFTLNYIGYKFSIEFYAPNITAFVNLNLICAAWVIDSIPSWELVLSRCFSPKAFNPGYDSLIVGLIGELNV